MHSFFFLLRCLSEEHKLQLLIVCFVTTKKKTQLPRNMQTHINNNRKIIVNQTRKKEKKNCNVNETTSCLSVNDLVRLNARIYKILHTNSNIGFCLRVKRTRRGRRKKKALFIKRLKDRHYSYWPEGKLRRKKNLLKMRATLFAKPFFIICRSFVSLAQSTFISNRIQKLLSQMHNDERNKKTIPKLIIFIFQKVEKKRVRTWGMKQCVALHKQRQHENKTKEPKMNMRAQF